MYVSYKFIIILLFFAIIKCDLLSKSCSINGVISDSVLLQSLSSASISLFNKNHILVKGTLSAKDGSFKLDGISPGEYIIKATYIGYKTFERPLQLKEDEILSLNINLIEDVIGLNQVVVTGVASRNEKAVADVAVARIDATELQKNNNYQDLDQMLVGKVPGVHLETSSGEVGISSRFTVRGGGGLNGNGQPIIYVDGIRIFSGQIDESRTHSNYSIIGSGGEYISSLSDLNTRDIQSIEVMKGPVGSALYGTNGSNGVILITTNRGKSDVDCFNVNFQSTTGWNVLADKYKSSEYVDADRMNGLFRAGPINEYNLNLSGKHDIYSFYAGFSNRKEEGNIINSAMDRSSGRLNLDIIPSNEIAFKLSSNFIMDRHNQAQAGDNTWSWWGAAFVTGNDSIGLAGINTEFNSKRALLSAAIDYLPSFLQGLSSRAVIGYDIYTYEGLQTTPWGYNISGFPKGIKFLSNETFSSWNFDYNITYAYELMKNLQTRSIIGTQLYSNKIFGDILTTYNFPNKDLSNSGSGINLGGAYTDDWILEQRQAGIFFQQEFNYDDVYFLNLAIRKDYSSVISKDAPSIFYPKLSGLIRIDKLGLNIPYFNFIKLRGGYGESGQLPQVLDAIPITWTGVSSGYGTGGLTNSYGNPGLQPERIKEYEVGLELEALNAYGIDFTYYHQNANQSILRTLNLPSTGQTASAVPGNIGDVECWGIEALIYASPILTKDYRLDFNLIVNYNDNKIISLGGGDGNVGGVGSYNYGRIIWYEGYRRSSFVEYQVLGANFDSTTGKYIGPKVSNNLKLIGNPIPLWTGSFKTSFTFMKNFTLSFLFEWALDLFVKNITLTKFVDRGENVEYNNLKSQLDNLQVGSSEYKAVADQFAHWDTQYWANYIEPADWLRLREISLKIDLTDYISDFVKYTNIKNIYVGAQVRNALLFTKYKGPDPSVSFVGSDNPTTFGTDFFSLPSPRTYNFFINLGF
jgi:TonB-dependent SusC/RagA subfamily outer membrane receptor